MNNFSEMKREKFQYNFKPSLGHIARVNVVLLAWNHPDIKSSITNLFSAGDRRAIEMSYWSQIEREVIEKVKLLPLPKSVIESVVCYVSDVGKQIIGWIMYYKKMISSGIQGSESLSVMNHFDNFVWTPRGTINRIKTAQSIMSHNEISTIEKYFAACTFCMEKEIVIYAENSDVKNVAAVYKSAYAKRVHPLLWFWTHCAEGKFNELHRQETQFTTYESLNHCLLDLIMYSEKSISGESDAAIKNIWCRLTEYEKDRLIKPILMLCSAECCCFLLSQISRSLEQKILRKQSHNVLKLFIEDSLWIDEVIPMVRYMFQYFTEESYSEIMKLLQRYLKYYRKKTSNFLMYRKYAEILEEMWILSPPDYRNDIFERDDHLGAEIIYTLVWELSEKIIRSIFIEITPVQRKDVMESKYGVKKCIYFIATNQKKSFEEFLSLAFTEKWELNAFKKTLMEKQSLQIFSIISKERSWSGMKDFFTWFCNLPRISEDELWRHIDVIFENYFDDHSIIIENKAHVVVCYFSDNNEPGKEKNSAKFEKIMKWYLYPFKVHYKPETHQNEHLNLLIHFCLKENNFNLADRVLKLFFIDYNALEIEWYKQLVFCSTENMILIFDRIVRKDNFKSLEDYLNWCFPSPETRIFDYKLVQNDFFRKLLKSSNYELVNDYISWLKVSDKEVFELKCNLIFEAAVCQVANVYFENEISVFRFLSKSRKLIEWINPRMLDTSRSRNGQEYPSKFLLLLNECRKKETS